MARILSKLAQFRSDLDASLGESGNLTSADFANIKEGFKFYEESERKIRQFIRECYLDYINCDVASFIHESQDSLVEAAAKFYKPKVSTNDVVVFHPEDRGFCKSPLSIDDVLSHRDEIRSKAKLRGHWMFARRCIVLNGGAGRTHEIHDEHGLPKTSVDKCRNQKKKTIIQWRRDQFSIRCESKAYGCQIACWL